MAEQSNKRPVKFLVNFLFEKCEHHYSNAVIPLNPNWDGYTGYITCDCAICEEDLIKWVDRSQLVFEFKCIDGRGNGTENDFLFKAYEEEVAVKPSCNKRQSTKTKTTPKGNFKAAVRTSDKLFDLCDKVPADLENQVKRYKFKSLPNLTGRIGRRVADGNRIDEEAQIEALTSSAEVIAEGNVESLQNPNANYREADRGVINNVPNHWSSFGPYDRAVRGNGANVTIPESQGVDTTYHTIAGDQTQNIGNSTQQLESGIGMWQQQFDVRGNVAMGSETTGQLNSQQPPFDLVNVQPFPAQSNQGTRNESNFSGLSGYPPTDNASIGGVVNGYQNGHYHHLQQQQQYATSYAATLYPEPQSTGYISTGGMAFPEPYRTPDENPASQNTLTNSSNETTPTQQHSQPNEESNEEMLNNLFDDFIMFADELASQEMAATNEALVYPNPNRQIIPVLGLTTNHKMLLENFRRHHGKHLTQYANCREELLIRKLVFKVYARQNRLEQTQVMHEGVLGGFKVLPYVNIKGVTVDTSNTSVFGPVSCNEQPLEPVFLDVEGWRNDRNENIEKIMTTFETGALVFWWEQCLPDPDMAPTVFEHPVFESLCYRLYCRRRCRGYVKKTDPTRLSVLPMCYKAPFDRIHSPLMQFREPEDVLVFDLFQTFIKSLEGLSELGRNPSQQTFRELQNRARLHIGLKSSQSADSKHLHMKFEIRSCVIDRMIEELGTQMLSSGGINDAASIVTENTAETEPI